MSLQMGCRIRLELLMMIFGRCTATTGILLPSSLHTTYSSCGALLRNGRMYVKGSDNVMPIVFQHNSPKHGHEGRAARVVALVAPVIESSSILSSNGLSRTCLFVWLHKRTWLSTLLLLFEIGSFVCEGSCQHHPHYSATKPQHPHRQKSET